MCTRVRWLRVALVSETGELVERRLTPDHREILQWARGLPGPVAVTDEAGPTGFVLARFLLAAGSDAGRGGGAVEAATPVGGSGQDRYP